ncbi:MAG: hypothetical protein ABIO76_09730, partial [Ginsengibacter sp.]
MRKLLLLLPLFAVKVCSAQTIENYLSAPFPTNLVASSDGKTIAWIFNDKGSRNIYVADGPAYNVKAITNYQGDDGTDISNVQFTPGGDQVIFVRGNALNNDGEPANPAFLQTSTARNIWIVDKNGGDPRELTAGAYYKISPDGKTMAYTSAGQVWILSLADTTVKPEKLFQSRGMQSQLRWSPDGKTLAFVSDRDNHSFVGIYSFISRTVNFIETSMDNDTYPVWSPGGKQLAYIRIPAMNNVIPFVPVRESNPWSIRMLDVTSGKTKELWKASAGRGSVLFTDIPTEKNLLWWVENGHLVFPCEKDGWQHLYELNINSGK